MLFTGFMLTASGPKVLEYNVRFGDPETEALMLLLDAETDLAAVLLVSIVLAELWLVLIVISRHASNIAWILCQSVYSPVSQSRACWPRLDTPEVIRRGRRSPLARRLPVRTTALRTLHVH